MNSQNNTRAVHPCSFYSVFQLQDLQTTKYLWFMLTMFRHVLPPSVFGFESLVAVFTEVA